MWYNHFRFTTDNNIYIYARDYGCGGPDGSITYYNNSNNIWSNAIIVSSGEQKCVTDASSHLQDIAVSSDNIPYTICMDDEVGSSATCRRVVAGVVQKIGSRGFSPKANYTNISLDSNDVPFVAFKDSVANSASVMIYDSILNEWNYLGDSAITEYCGNVSFRFDNNYLPTIAGTNWSGKIFLHQFDGNSWKKFGNVDYIDDVTLGLGSNNSYNFSGSWRQRYPFEFDNQNRPVIAFIDKNNGRPTVSRYNGTNWELLDTTALSGKVASIITMDVTDNGDIYLGYGATENRDTIVDLYTINIRDTIIDSDTTEIRDTIIGLDTNTLTSHNLTVVKYSDQTANIKFQNRINSINTITATPNPFNPSTTISFENKNKNTSIFIYNIKGGLVKSFINVKNNSVIWNAKNQASGLYILKAVSASSIKTTPLVLLK